MRQDVGGGCRMALALRKVARQWMPAGPRNFSSWGGRVLNPLLFVALYFVSRVAANSCCVMRLSSGLSRG